VGSVKATAFQGDGSGLTALPAGSGNYIQNQVANPQAGGGFSISGNGFVGGQVGIGTTSPTAKLEVSDGNTYLGQTSIGRSGSHFQEIGYNVGFTTTNNVYTYRVADKAVSMRMGFDGFEFRTAASGTAGSALTFTERMRISSGGNVGIGTNAPAAKLDLDGPSGDALLRLRVSKTPASSADPSGSVGSFAWDDNYVYVKTSKGWKRSSLTTF
jgi:hypothetical protein